MQYRYLRAVECGCSGRYKLVLLAQVFISEGSVCKLEIMAASPRKIVARVSYSFGRYMAGE